MTEQQISGGNRLNPMSIKYVLLCVALETVVLTVGAFVALTAGVDPDRVITMVTIVGAVSITPLFALARMGEIEQRQMHANDKISRAVENTDRLTNGELEARLRKVVKFAMEDYDKQTKPK